MKTSKWKRSLSIIMSVIVLCGTVQSSVLPVYATETSEVVSGSGEQKESGGSGEQKETGGSGEQKESGGSGEQKETGESGEQEGTSETKESEGSGTDENKTDEPKESEGNGTNENKTDEPKESEGSGTGENKTDEPKESEGTDESKNDEIVIESDADEIVSATQPADGTDVNNEIVVLSDEPMAIDEDYDDGDDTAIEHAHTEDDVEQSGDLTSTITWTLYKDGCLVISGTGAIPGYQTNTYTTAPYYEYHDKITSVIIGDNITSIGSYAFYWVYTNLQTVAIGNDVTTIGTGAFNRCTSLERIEIPAGVTTINQSAFYNCASLTSITLPDTLTTIGDSAFAQCTSLESIEIPAGVTKIGNYVFSSCTGLTGITLPDTLTSIGQNAFKDCTSLERITLLDTLTSIGQNAFYGCAGLTSITLPDSLTSIGSYAFYGCTSLERITIPNSVTRIDDSAFSGCTGLKEVNTTEASTENTNTNKLLTINRYAFSSCTSLETVTLPYASVGERAFVNCTSLKTVKFNDRETNSTAAATIGQYAFTSCPALESITIPYGVTSIGASAFSKYPNNISGYSSCTSLQNITIPSSVTSIGDYAFSGCTKISSMNIPSGVTNIGTAAFSNCTGLIDLTLPSGLKTIGQSAFSGCSKLSSVTIPDAVTSLGSFAFQSCTGLTSAVLPSGLTSIPEYLFSGCTALTTVTIPDTVTQINTYAFYNCSKLSGITLPDNLTSIGSSAFSGCSKLSSITLPDSLTTINNNAFYGCSKLRTLTLPKELTSIGSNAFNNTTSLKTVTLNSKNLSTVSYSNYSFGTGIQDVYIGTTVENLSDQFILAILNQNPSAEFHFNGPTTFTYTGSTKTIGTLTLTKDCRYYVADNGAIYQLVTSTSGTSDDSTNTTTSYTAVLLSVPDTFNETGTVKNVQELLNVESIIPGDGNTYTVTEIGERAFADRTDLTEITIPNNIKKIDDYAFYNCKNLTSVTFADSSTIDYIGISAFSKTNLKKVNGSEQLSTFLVSNLSQFTSAFVGTPLMSASGSIVTTGLALDTGKVKIKLNVGSDPKGLNASGESLELLTGMKAQINISLDKLTENVDGNAIIYFQFEEGNTAEGVDEQGNATLFNFKLGESQDFDKVSTETHKYISGTFEAVPGAPHCYRLVLTNLNAGNTLNLNLSASYENKSSGGGNMLVWMEVNENTTTNGTVTDKSNMNLVRWTTREDKFTVSKSESSNSSTYPNVKGDGTENGDLKLYNLNYSISMGKTTSLSSTYSSYGKDYVKKIVFEDKLTLPDGFEWKDGLLDAIRNDNYEISGSSSSWTMKVSIDGKDVTLATLSGPSSGSGKYYGAFTLSVDKDENDKDTVVIHWIYGNSYNTSQEVTLPTFTLRYGADAFVVNSAKVTNGLENSTTTQYKEITNRVTATEYFTYGEEQTGSASAAAKVRVSPANFSISKSSSGSSYMGGSKTFSISLANTSSLNYQGVYKVYDPMSNWYYIEPINMAGMFNNATYGKNLTILIKNASLYDYEDSQATVTATDGKEYTIYRPMTGGNLEGTKPTEVKYAYSYIGYSMQPATATNVSMEIKWNAAGTGLVMTVTNGTDVKTYELDATGSAIEDQLHKIGYAVTNDVTYNCTWNWSEDDHFTIYSGQTRTLSIPATIKNSFMKLTADTRNKYGSNSSDYITTAANTAYAYYGDQSANKYAYSSVSPSIYRDFTLTKSASIGGKTVTDSSDITPGSMITYTANVSRYSSSLTYDAVPLVDRMAGGQILLALVSENTDLKDKGLMTQTIDGKEYYLLTVGSYKNVKIGDYLADHVEVTQESSGLNTMIYWYLHLTNSSSSTAVKYSVLVNPELAGIGSDNLSSQYTLSNKVWLGDDAGNRLYDYCYLHGYLMKIDKYEVTNAELPVSATHDSSKDELIKRSIVTPGRQVTYRLGIYAVGTSNVRISGKDIYDTLPGSYDNYWSKENISVTYVSTDGSNVSSSDGDEWYIVDEAKEAPGATQQTLRWNENFSLQLKGTMYIYVTLTFPVDTEESSNWTNLSKIYGADGFTNTWHVYDLTDSVYHDLSVQAQVRLQKGVYATGGSSGSSDFTISSDEESLLYYNNSTNKGSNAGIVTYYLTLYNSGYSRMYLSDIQDVLPEGFTFASLYYTPSRVYYINSYRYNYNNNYYYNSAAVVKDGATKVSYRKANITASTKTLNGHTVITFKLAGGDLSYDSGEGKYYLRPGQAVVIAYNCYTGKYENSKDDALNSVAMQYYDYNGAGMRIDDSVAIMLNNSKKTLNDGDCKAKTTKEIGELGMDTTDKSNLSGWLYSDVTVSRGTIAPGIQKTCKVEQASTTDTIGWDVVAYNSGTTALVDYTLTDVMMNPYQMTGAVSYGIYRTASSSSALLSATLFTIKSRTSTSVTLQYGSSKTIDVLLDGTPVTLTSNVGNIRVSFSQDSNNNEVMSIYFLDTDYAAIPAGGRAIMTVNTKNNTNLNENKTFINKCYLTPNSQTFEANSVSQGTYVQYDLPSDDVSDILPSVVSEAQVAVSYGYATKSVKKVTERIDGGKTASSNEATNYIVLSQGVDSKFRYELQVENSGGNSVAQDLNLLVLIDNLPEVGDHTTFYTDYPRYSDFQVDFAEEDDLNPVVTIKTSDGKSKTLSSSQYTIQFSKQTNLDYAKNVALWEGEKVGTKEGWYTLAELKANDNLDLQDMRSFRIVIEDPEETGMMPAKSTVSFGFNAVVHDDEENIPEASQIAWNSFGYLYQIGSLKLQASPLNVGVKIAGVPEMVKNLTDAQKKPYEATEDETFRFIICKGSVTLLADQKTDADKYKWLTDMEIPFTVLDLKVEKGQSSSETIKLDQLKLCTYDAETESYKETEATFGWSDKSTYTVTELTQEGGSKYTFGNINSNKSNQYVFTYDKASSIRLTATNVRKEWDIQIQKTDSEGKRKLSGAIFAVYSKNQSDQLAENAALPEKLNVKPDWTLTNDDGTWYLKDIQTTDELGQIKWSKLTDDEYYVLELQAPFGYRLGKDPGQVVKWTTGTEVEQVNIVNASIFQLPHSGGMGTTIFTISGLCLIAAGLIHMWLKRRRKR